LIDTIEGASTGYDIAVIGAAGRFPGARHLAQFWGNLRAGVESIKFFTDEELLRAGESPEALHDPAYVKAQPVLDDFDQFDAALFGFSPQDAAVMDPQHRVFLEVGWEALENAGHDSETFGGTIGVFATCGMNTYMMYNLVRNRRIMDTVGEWLVRHTGNDMNFLATRLSYELNLKGPSMNVQTACSSALVAIHQACQSLLSGECDMALAGGATIVLPHARGYLYKEGEILSPDGHCRPFDAQARGTLFGSGAGAVVLRRRADAAAAGDQILAIIKGSAINNDGSDKVGYLAPSVEGQSRSIVEALSLAQVDPATISYVETHGTGTTVGDPIEFVALAQAFRQFTDRCGFCAIGSLKSNIGHLGEAAGVAAFIKTVLALKHREIPPSLHYESPNPQIDFASSPFYVNAQLAPWRSPHGPRRAGITSLGAGGTNCHVIVEEPPAPPPSGPARPAQLLLLSARTPSALETAAQNLAGHLAQHPELDLADVAYTLHAGRKALPHRRAVVCRDGAEASELLRSQQGVVTSKERASGRPVAFLFPGQGAQYPGMGRELYESEPVFRDEVDRCAELLKGPTQVDLRDAIVSAEDSSRWRERLNQTALTQPALFLLEYGIAKLWMSWGVQPQAMIGHSIGEYVAACLAGVLSLEDALALVAERGRLMQQAPPGAMLAVSLPAAEIESLLAAGTWGAGLSLAAVNAPSSSVIAGPEDAVAIFQAQLAARDVPCQRLQTSHAFHSALMEPILDSFGARVRGVALRAPSIPYLSNLTGTWIRNEEATEAAYWVRHLRSTVRFSDCLSNLLQNGRHVLLEVGPGRSLGGLARQQPSRPDAVLHSLGKCGEGLRDLDVLLKSCGQLWVLGCKLDPSGLYARQRRSRVPLPAYPFERKRYWIDADAAAPPSGAEEPPGQTLRKKPDIADWFYVPVWKRSAPPPPAPAGSLAHAPENWLLFLDESGLGFDLIERLRRCPPPEAAPDPVRLEVAAPGELEYVRIMPAERSEPGPGQVEIRVRAAALNFADVLKATGVFPDVPFGMECAGLIERVGPDVADFCVGDEVVAIGPDSFASYVVRDARLVARKPDLLSMEEAATLPAAFMTAWHALHHVGRLRTGEKVLIHAAAGGVGLAAVQVARLAGAEIFATAGNPEKRAFLKSLGIRHVFDSRSLEFAQSVMKRTRRKGVDVVLNSLTGEFIPRGLGLLAEGGRFLEIGKKEIYKAAQLSELPLRPKVTYHPIDLSRLYRDDREGYASLFGEVVEMARQRRFEPIPRQLFPFAAATRAFQLMTEARHIGKIVLSLRPADPEIYVVRPGTGYRRQSAREFVVDPGREADYKALVAALDADQSPVDRIVHFWSVPAAASGLKPLQKWLDRAFFSLTWLTKAVGSVGWEHPIDLTVVSTGLQQIAGETRIEPVKATLHGPCRVIPREFPNMAASSIDVPATSPGTWQRELLVGQLLAELRSNIQARVVAFRAADRWVQRCEPATLPRDGQAVPLRRGGVYLITGGLGGLGLVFAEYLARTVQAKLVLVGRSALPPRSQWNDRLASRPDDNPVGAKIRSIERCEASGGTVLVAPADVTDRNQMRGVIAEARRQFGTIHGVIHAAGSMDDGLVQTKTIESLKVVLAPKVQGALVLDDVLGDAPLDFCALCSSVSSIFGFQGHVDYTAANAFLDAFAASRTSRRPGKTVAINWCVWRDVGMAAKVAPAGRSGSVTRGAINPPRESQELDGRAVERPKHSSQTDALSAASLADEAMRQGIDPGEGIDAFERILACGVVPQVIVSSVDLQIWMKRVDATGQATARAAGTPLSATWDRRGKATPNSGKGFDGDPVEKRLAAMYSEILGVDTLGLRDDFFELGGHSLLAVRLLTRIEREFKKSIPLPALFQSATIEHLATFLRDDDAARGATCTESGAIVPLSKCETGPAFFCVHSVGGEVMSFRHLAHHLGPQHRLYGIQVPSELRDAAFASSIESMARYYVKELIEFQSEGPYLLGGWSAGSVIALEMAHQLNASGREVELLVALDGAPLSAGGGTSPWSPAYYWKLLCNLPRWVADDLMLDVSLPSLARRVRNKLVSLSKKAAAALRGRQNRHEYEVEGFLDTSHFSDAQIKFMGALLAALYAFKARPYAGRVLLFKAKTEPLYHLLEVEKKWKTFAKDLEVVTVGGTHESIVREPYVRAVASALKPVLAAFGPLPVPEPAVEEVLA
jgi:acyl transferase domain-containing protein/NADPH:quinone reductase-like Zn-dependent oxidoreductase/thioesterase domain-containing protein/NAD(P)-dependent dehydrogenase (short-subunit alcohol dehydrogenase family)/acyl carrier protein